ncbi:hypothetical protein BDR26DRAFT_857873 [Obelidium mucronatum]|nr:hypothetical protein BDR26DRAFT_857873 [Obelidium mucronatum]
MLATALSISKGVRVAICMRNSPQWIFAFWATLVIGGISVAVNSSLHPIEMEYCILDSDPEFVFVDRELASKLGATVEKNIHIGWILCAEKKFVDGFKKAHPKARVWSFDEFLQKGKHQNTLPDVEILPEDDATILYTSGTTGKPKGVLATHRSYAQAIMSRAYTNAFYSVLESRSGGKSKTPVDPSAQPVLLHASPLFHTMGLITVPLVQLIGGKIIMLPRWNATSALHLIETYRVNTFVGVPTMFIQMLNHPNLQKFDLSSVKGFAAGGAPTSQKTLEGISSNLPTATRSTGYGLTETNSCGAILSSPLIEKKPSSTGIVCEPLDVLIVQVPSDGRSLDLSKDVLIPVKNVGDIGEIAIRFTFLMYYFKGPMVFKGYWRNPEATARVLTADGWFITGDIGKFDSDGCLYILDRAKDMIIRGGENIYCAEVEDVISAHPKVLECAVVGIPDAVFGEAVLAIVRAKKGVQVGVKDIIDHCKSRLALYKCPARVEFWSCDVPFPRNAAGKVLKNDLKKRYTIVSSKL